MSLSLDIPLGFSIPQPLLQEISLENGEHVRMESIEDSNGVSNNTVKFGVYTHNNDNEWLNHDPHVFMYLDSSKISSSDTTVGGESGRTRNHRLIHPSTWSDGTLLGRTSPMFSNYSGGDHDFFIPKQRPSEWEVNSKDFYSSIIELNPSVYFVDNNRSPNIRTNDFFPIDSDSWHGYDNNNPIRLLSTKKGSASGYLGNKKCLILYFRFVIRHPEDTRKPVVGPLSRKIVIGPQLGHFEEGMIYHKWKTEID